MSSGKERYIKLIAKKYDEKASSYEKLYKQEQKVSTVLSK